MLSALPVVPAGEGEEEAPHGLGFRGRGGARWRQSQATPTRELQALFEQAAGEAPQHPPDPQAERAPLPAFLRGLVADLGSADAFALDARLRGAVALERPAASRTWGPSWPAPRTPRAPVCKRVRIARFGKEHTARRIPPRRPPLAVYAKGDALLAG